MASVAAIRSVGTSLADFLNRTYQEQKNEELNPAFAGVALPNCVFNIISSGRIQEQDDPSEAAVSVFSSFFTGSASIPIYAIPDA